ncbi:MAG: lipid A deacylase LpxR family protein [Gammaproteobacteria bacterium]|nr:lipid A deacylase LpxR family protein [Gammaproteobacteria bacterium]
MAIILRPACVLAQSTALPYNDSWTASVMFENDLFGNSDRSYTNGVKLSWISGDLTQYREAGRIPRWLSPLVDAMPFINETGLQRNVSFSLDQQIFTPADISVAELVTDDRPYAGWLNFSVAFHNKNLHRMDTVQLVFGVVGPAALGGDAQNFVHKVRDIPTARGWANQLRNEPGFNIVIERKRRLLQSTNPRGIGYDLISHYGGALGNVHIYGNAGIEARFGWNLPADFGLSMIRPGGEVSGPVDNTDPRLNLKSRFGAHLFAAVAGRLVGRNLFLDGNTFRDSHSVNKRHAVGDLIVGGSLLYRGVKLSYAQVWRTREFRNQPKFHNFGSIGLSWTF